jgi:hypothetical protein
MIRRCLTALGATALAAAVALTLGPVATAAPP